jgi:hypothetical protein
MLHCEIAKPAELYNCICLICGMVWFVITSTNFSKLGWGDCGCKRCYTFKIPLFMSILSYNLFGCVNCWSNDEEMYAVDQVGWLALWLFVGHSWLWLWSSEIKQNVQKLLNWSGTVHSILIYFQVDSSETEKLCLLMRNGGAICVSFVRFILSLKCLSFWWTLGNWSLEGKLLHTSICWANRGVIKALIIL